MNFFKSGLIQALKKHCMNSPVTASINMKAFQSKKMKKNPIWDAGTVQLKKEGQYADLAVLSADYFSVPVKGIKNIESVLTVVRKIVRGSEEFSSLMPKLPPILPHWPPVKYFGPYYKNNN